MRMLKYGLCLSCIIKNEISTNQRFYLPVWLCPTSTKRIHFDGHHDIKLVFQVIKKLEVCMPPFSD